MKATDTALCRRKVTSWTYTCNTYRKIVLLTLSYRKCFVCLFWNDQKYPRVHIMTFPGVKICYRSKYNLFKAATKSLKDIALIGEDGCVPSSHGTAPCMYRPHNLTSLWWIPSSQLSLGRCSPSTSNIVNINRGSWSGPWHQMRLGVIIQFISASCFCSKLWSHISQLLDPY